MPTGRFRKRARQRNRKNSRAMTLSAISAARLSRRAGKIESRARMCSTLRSRAVAALGRALVGEFGVVTYESLQQRVNAVAAGLLDLGLQRGDLVLIKMSNSPEFAVAFLAAVKLGVIPVLVNSLLTAVELTAVLEQTRPRLIFTEVSRTRAPCANCAAALCSSMSFAPANPKGVKFHSQRWRRSRPRPLFQPIPEATSPLSSFTPPEPPANPKVSFMPIAGLSRSVI